MYPLALIFGNLKQATVRSSHLRSMYVYMSTTVVLWIKYRICFRPSCFFETKKKDGVSCFSCSYLHGWCESILAYEKYIYSYASKVAVKGVNFNPVHLIN